MVGEYGYRLTLYHYDRQRRVIRRRSERFMDTCVIEWDRFGGVSVMVFGSISYGLKITNGYGRRKFDRGKLERRNPPPCRPDLTFQQDNARLHVGRVCQE